MISIDAQPPRVAIKVEAIRGRYQQGEHGWHLQAPLTKAGVWQRQDLLPACFRVTASGAIEALTSDGTQDWRFPVSISMGLIHDRVARGHVSTLVRGHLSMGSLYAYAASPTERWLELVTLPVDVNEPASSERRIAMLMSNSDPVMAREIGQTIRRHLMQFTPITTFNVSGWLA